MQLFYSMISYWYNKSKIDGFSLKIRGLLLFVSDNHHYKC